MATFGHRNESKLSSPSVRAGSAARIARFSGMLLIVSSAALLFTVSASEPPSSVPVAFRAAVAKRVNAGLEIKDTRSLRSDETEWLFVLGYEPGPLGGQDYLYAFVRGNDGIVRDRAVGRDTFAMFGTISEQRESPLAVQHGALADVNGDGKPELIISRWGGGNAWGCSSTIAYEVRGPRMTRLISGAMVLEDLDHDGTEEVVLVDGSWQEYGPFSHAQSPGGHVVFRWRNGRYEFAGPEFRAYYDEAKRRNEREFAALDAADDLDRMHLALSAYIDSVRFGDKTGLDLLRQRLGSMRSSAYRYEFAYMLRDFTKGWSAMLLARPVIGEPLLQWWTDESADFCQGEWLQSWGP